MGDGPIHPWSTCSVNDCVSRSRCFAPGQGWICGKCYRRAPKRLRDQRAHLGRKAGRHRDPTYKRRIERARGRLVDRMVTALNTRGDDQNMSPGMAEELRRDGLL